VIASWISNGTHRDAIPLDAAVVLDRNEPEEPVELAGAPRLLVGRERGGAKALEPRVHRLRGPLDRRGSPRVGCPFEARQQ
jgi:hypothetical protein